MNEFQQRLQAARDAQRQGAEMAEQFGQNVPAAMYVGRLQKFQYSPSSNDRPQVARAILIEQGEQKGNVVRDYMGMEHPVAVAMLDRFISDMGYQVPEYFDYEASERQQSFVLTKDMDDTLAAIEDAAPLVQFRVVYNGDFCNLRIFKIIDFGSQDVTIPAARIPATPPPPPPPPRSSTPSSRSAANGTRQPASPAGAQPPDAQVPVFENLLELCAAQGIDTVNQGMGLDGVAKHLRENYSFWTCDVAPEQIAEFDGCSPEQGLTPEDVAILDVAGLGDIVIRPVAAPAPTRRRSGGARRRS